METNDAVRAFGALAQDTRLRVVRMLVEAGPLGLPAGTIAGSLGVPPATLSFHLKELSRASLVAARREDRHIFYSADLIGIRDLLGFLTEECCQGRPEICAPFLNRAGRRGEPAPKGRTPK